MLRLVLCWKRWRRTELKNWSRNLRCKKKGIDLLWKKMEEQRKCKSGECSTSVYWVVGYCSQGVVCMEEQLMSKHIGTITTCIPFNCVRCLHWPMWSIVATICSPSNIGVYHQSNAQSWFLGWSTTVPTNWSMPTLLIQHDPSFSTSEEVLLNKNHKAFYQVMKFVVFSFIIWKGE